MIKGVCFVVVATYPGQDSLDKEVLNLNGIILVRYRLNEMFVHNHDSSNMFTFKFSDINLEDFS